MFGMKAVSDIKGVYWTVNLVVCNQCGCTQIFTRNTAEVAAQFASQTQTVPER